MIAAGVEMYDSGSRRPISKQREQLQEKGISMAPEKHHVEVADRNLEQDPTEPDSVAVAAAAAVAQCVGGRAHSQLIQNAIAKPCVVGKGSRRGRLTTEDETDCRPWWQRLTQLHDCCWRDGQGGDHHYPLSLSPSKV